VPTSELKTANMHLTEFIFVSGTICFWWDACGPQVVHYCSKNIQLQAITLQRERPRIIPNHMEATTIDKAAT